jgi:hypothetical protein
MKCPCCEKELTPKVIAKVKASIAALELDPPAPGSMERTRMLAMQSLVEKFEAHVASGGT